MATQKTEQSGQVAVIESSGKQVLARVGDTIKVPLLSAETGSTVTVQDLLSGKPVSASVVSHGRYPKVTGRLFHNKVRGSRYPRGHKQDFTSIQLTAIK